MNTKLHNLINDVRDFIRFHHGWIVLALTIAAVIVAIVFPGTDPDPFDSGWSHR